MASFWSNVFGQSTSDSEPSASVLAEWNKYSTDAAGNLQAFHWWLFPEPRSVLPAPMTRKITQLPAGMQFTSNFGKSAGPSTVRAQSDRLLGKMEEGGSHVQNFVSTSFSRIQTGAQGVGSSLGTTMQRCALCSHAATNADTRCQDAVCSHSHLLCFDLL